MTICSVPAVLKNKIINKNTDFQPPGMTFDHEIFYVITENSSKFHYFCPILSSLQVL